MLALPRNYRPFCLAASAAFVAAFLRLFHLSRLAPEAMFDEVWFALRARELLSAPQLVVFYRTSWGGSNALMVYLTAIAQSLGFTGISAARLPAAVLGVAAVPLAYACFGEMLRGESGWIGQRRQWIAALSALVLAYLLHWVIISRVGLESSLAPAAALFCVWQLRRAKRLLAAEREQPAKVNALPRSSQAVDASAAVSYLLLGIAAGVAQYSGPHARFILPLLGFAAVHDLLLTPASRRRLIAGYALAAVAFLAITAPLALFFIREPAWLVARARLTGINLWSDPAALLQNAFFILLSFNFVGSFDPTTNYPGLPMFDVIQSAGFLAGHAWLLWQWRRSAAARDLLLWEALMTLPSLLTGGAPSFQRMSGFGAPASAVIAVGWLAIARWLSIRLASASLRALVHWGLGFGVCFSLIYQSSIFLFRYPHLWILPFAFNAQPVDMARNLIARADSGERAFVSRNPEDDDVAAFEYLFPGTKVERLDLRQCLPLTDQRRVRANYLVLTKRDKQSVITLAEAYPTANISSSYFWQDSGTLLEVPPGAPAPRASHAGYAKFEPGLTFAGYDWSGSSIPAGQSLFITLYWKAEADLSTDYTSFIHVGTGLDGAAIVAQRDGFPCQGLFSTSRWRAGDLVRDSFAITLPPDAPAGKYPLAIGWYTYPDLARLPLAAAENPLADDRAVMATITITR